MEQIYRELKQTLLNDSRSFFALREMCGTDFAYIFTNLESHKQENLLHKHTKFLYIARYIKVTEKQGTIYSRISLNIIYPLSKCHT